MHPSTKETPIPCPLISILSRLISSAFCPSLKNPLLNDNVFIFGLRFDITVGRSIDGSTSSTDPVSFPVSLPVNAEIASTTLSEMDGDRIFSIIRARSLSEQWQISEASSSSSNPKAGISFPKKSFFADRGIPMISRHSWIVFASFKDVRIRSKTAACSSFDSRITRARFLFIRRFCFAVRCLSRQSSIA